MRVVGEAPARRSALSADVQRTAAVGGPVDGAEAAVRSGERAAGGRKSVALERGDKAGGVFCFFSRKGFLGFFVASFEFGCFDGLLGGDFPGVLLFFLFFGLAAFCFDLDNDFGALLFGSFEERFHDRLCVVHRGSTRWGRGWVWGLL